jgi:hypothetical protein
MVPIVIGGQGQIVWGQRSFVRHHIVCHSGLQQSVRICSSESIALLQP